MLSPLQRIGGAPWNHRPHLAWPKGARTAIWVIPNVELYDYVPPAEAFGVTTIPPPDLPSYCVRDYGNRVGFWRMLEVLDQHQIRCTVNINLAVLEHFPQIKAAMLDRDWDFCFHGFYNTRAEPRGLDEDAERAFYRSARERFAALTGKPLRGINFLRRATAALPDLVAELGFTYHADWFHDDQPTPVRVARGRLVSVPYSVELNDALLVLFDRPYEMDYFVQICKDQFDRLYRDGAESGTVMCVVLHPWVIGYPHRINALDEILTYVKRHEDVWLATADEIAAYYLDHYHDAMLAHATRFADGIAAQSAHPPS